jgi:endo-1,4-beta-xylanase
MKTKFTFSKTTKLMTSAILCFTFISMSLVLKAADPPVAKIMKTDAAPAIDGNANDPMWENAQVYSLDSVAKGTPSNSSATWKALWDEEFIYILVEVEDDILGYSADIKEWNRDAVEVFFDLGNTDDQGESIGVKEYDVGDWQFRYNLVDKSITVGRGEDGVATDSKEGDHIETGTNYVVELKFKWSELKSSLDFTPEKDVELGIEVAVMDNDGTTDDDFQGAMSWYANANEAHKTSTYFGTATLDVPIIIPSQTSEIVKTDAAPAIDGNANDPMWENANEYKIETVSNGEQSNNTATWKALWDEEYVYILVEVEDDILNYSDDIKEWNRDAVEVFFDLGNTDDEGESIGVKQYDVGDWQFRYNLVDNSISVGRGEDGVATDSKDAMHTENGTNYTVELKFAWAELKSSLDFNPSADVDLGIEVAVMDNDGEFVGALSWNADANEAHKTSTYFGTATLALTTAINEIRTNTVNIYPNPVAKVLNIENAAVDQVVSIFNITGQNVKNIFMENDQIDVADLKKGIYFIQIMDKTDEINTIKFVKK